ncbi:hypothetical protein EMIT07CA2_30277 [Brevibacillus sp. IT-7CA2]
MSNKSSIIIWNYIHSGDILVIIPPVVRIIVDIHTYINYYTRNDVIFLRNETFLLKSDTLINEQEY